MLSIVADLKWFYERFSAYTHPNLHKFNILWGIMIESKLIPRFRSLWCHQRPGKLTTALGLRPRAVVSFPGRWWHHNDLNLGINSYNHSQWPEPFACLSRLTRIPLGVPLRVNGTSSDIQGNPDRFVFHVCGAQNRLVLGLKEIESQSVA